jgi:competence protein ComGC
MNARPWNRKTSALTRNEVFVIIAIVAVLVALVLAGLFNPPKRSSRIGCSGNLKQIGLAFKLFANDNGDKYPASVSVTNGGALELVPRGDVFPHFQVMSNELQVPRILFCPNDSERTWATNFTSDFNDTHVSYFVGVDADEARPKMLLAGDRNIRLRGAPLAHGLASLTTNSPVRWSEKMHKSFGNVALADGSVQQVDAQELRDLLEKSRVTNRLAIP